MNLKNSRIDASTKTQFFEAFSHIQNTEEAQQFLEDLCSPAEREAMMDRWAVIDPIQSGMPYRRIHEETGVSITTVGRVARTLKYGTGGYSLIHQRIKDCH